MNGRFRDSRHLLRAALLFAAGILLFLVARAVFVPKGFGTYGHFREGAIADNGAREIAFAGRAACEDCHSDVVEARKGGKHAGIGCEACHGALSAHAAAPDPSEKKPARPDSRKLCLVCHLVNVAKPKAFPQVDPKDHGDACADCHKPHHPDQA